MRFQLAILTASLVLLASCSSVPKRQLAFSPWFPEVQCRDGSFSVHCPRF